MFLILNSNLGVFQCLSQCCCIKYFCIWAVAVGQFVEKSTYDPKIKSSNPATHIDKKISQKK